VAVPVFVYCPAVAVPVAVHVVEAPTARVAMMLLPPGVPVQLIALAATMLSVTATLVSATLPVLVTAYVHVTVEPTATVGPGAELLSVPFVFLTIERPGQLTLTDALLEPLYGLDRLAVFSTALQTVALVVLLTRTV
jgi:hypothetical protein